MTFGDRVVGAMKLDPNAFEDVERDPTAIGQSVGVIVLAAVATGILADEVDACRIERLDHLGQRIDDASNIAFAGFHALDGGQGDTGHPGQGLLVDPEQGSCGAQLCGGHHGGSSRHGVRQDHIYMLTRSTSMFRHFASDDGRRRGDQASTTPLLTAVGH